MPEQITYTVDILPNGDAEIKVPGGASQQRNAGKLASLTERLGKLLGRIKERHVGKPLDNHHHVHEDGSVHHNH